jgi:hypothetical protein
MACLIKSTFLTSFLLVWMLLMSYCNDRAPAERKVEAQGQVTEIRLDFTPMADPVSVFVVLSHDRRVKILNYAPYRLVVTNAYEGTLPESDMQRFLIKTRDPDFREALRRRDFTGTGLSSGDQFYLSLKVDQNITQECFGFVEDAPSIVGALVHDLLATRKQLTEAALADAYVRSEPIAKERFEALRRDGKLKFLTVREFPSNVQTILTVAINHPRDFHPLDRTQYEQLLGRSSSEQQFYVTGDGSGHQLSLFKARDDPALPTKGDE